MEITDEQKKNSLLIVDDENANLKVLARILSPDYTIYTAANGARAIEKAREHMPDLILLDIMMPEMDGYQTLSEIRKCEEFQKIPVVFITSLDSDEDEEKGLSLEAADYITKPFTDRIVELRVRNQIRIINQMRTIERLSMIDQLTNIPNRRSFDERLNMEWKRAIREQTPISILIMDMDKFKELNDTYGHPQGDVVLRTVASILPRAFRRPGDFAARWGGEEFIALLPGTSQEGAVEIAEKIRSDIENTKIPHADGSIRIGISIGVHSLIPARDSSIDAFFSNADKALYAAKSAGGNTVVTSG